ncbi:hypothetical protein [Candidatus Clostridium stratigraminis]|uniref:Uncharacterized protein n=1 Tax=Candidatus Clostridium stratigraminis TaxID=3381661 RepID=A0ABW8T039_9CLOT
MDIKSIMITIPIIVVIIGAIYINVILPKRIEKEQSEKQKKDK